MKEFLLTENLRDIFDKASLKLSPALRMMIKLARYILMVYSEHFALSLSACWSRIMRIMAKTGNIELEVTASSSQSPPSSPLMEIVRLSLLVFWLPASEPQHRPSYPGTGGPEGDERKVKVVELLPTWRWPRSSRPTEREECCPVAGWRGIWRAF